MKNPSTYRILPDEYQEVEYIETDGEAFVNTGVSPFFDGSSGLKIRCTASNFGLEGGPLFGCFGDSSGSDRLAVDVYQGNYRVIYHDSSDVLSGSHQWSVNQDYKNLPEDYIQLNSITGTTAQLIDTLLDVSGSYTLSPSFGTLAVVNNEMVTYSFNGELTSEKIYSGEDLLRDFIPCIYKNESVIGLYDLVGGTFHKNIGSSDFTAGTKTPERIKTTSQDPADYEEAMFTIELTKNHFKITSDGLEESVELTPHTVFESETPIYIFGANYENTGIYFTNQPVRIHDFQILNGDTLVRHFIPCYWKLTNESGFYDLVESKFYKNANFEELIWTINEAEGFTVSHDGLYMKDLNEGGGYTVSFV